MLLGGDGDGVDDHAAFGALDLVDFPGLLLDGEVAVDDAEAALLGHGDGHAGLGDGVHGSGEERGVEGDVAGEAGLGAHLGGDYFAECGDEEDVVKCEGFADRRFNHDVWEKPAWQRVVCGLVRLLFSIVVGCGGEGKLLGVVVESETKLQERVRSGVSLD